MLRAIFSKDVPNDLPAQAAEREDMARVTEEDWTIIQRLARGYCRTVDATRSRKRMDGSATLTRNGYGRYGTDDVSDDVTQDAVLLFARKFGRIIRTSVVASCSVTTREPDSWQYVRKNGNMMIATRDTVRRWAVRDAAARNGYRLDDPPSEIDAIPGAQLMAGVRHAEHLATTGHLAQNSDALFRMAWGDGSGFPTLGKIIIRGNAAPDLGRAPVLADVAHELYGGKHGSRYNVRRTRDAARKEWAELSARLDEARQELVYAAAR
ncbi:MULTISPECIES: hypothetical protein [Protofrankia]|uniref:Uncharacterized protein n=1 Tax=Protofrankia coriariae TaxID=1562887 RepID=A0ABR5F1G8_9ACTN|nr:MULTISPECIES: hypothetical protein [Protofrankia]KLL10568.1 hypothetical protein FrCorBMG51_16985 [Protofrankia coriariae]ONH34132.1 hypothetical protein BL254_17605 [Protofrankia sp. BMG5.30]